MIYFQCDDFITESDDSIDDDSIENVGCEWEYESRYIKVKWLN